MERRPRGVKTRFQSTHRHTSVRTGDVVLLNSFPCKGNVDPVRRKIPYDEKLSLSLVRSALHSRHFYTVFRSYPTANHPLGTDTQSEPRTDPRHYVYTSVGTTRLDAHAIDRGFLRSRVLTQRSIPTGSRSMLEFLGSWREPRQGCRLRLSKPRKPRVQNAVGR